MLSLGGWRIQISYEDHEAATQAVFIASKLRITILSFTNAKN